MREETIVDDSFASGFHRGTRHGSKGCLGREKRPTRIIRGGLGCPAPSVERNPASISRITQSRMQRRSENRV